MSSSLEQALTWKTENWSNQVMTNGVALKYNLKKKNQIFTIMKNLQAFMQGGHETVRALTLTSSNF